MSLLYEDVLNLIKKSGVDMVINFTAGMGGDLTLGSAEKPLPLSPAGTDMVGATERLGSCPQSSCRKSAHWIAER